MWRRAYRMSEHNVEAVAQGLAMWYQAQGFQVARHRVGEQVVIQAWRPAGWQATLGITPAWQVTLSSQAEGLSVEVGTAYRVDRTVAGAVGRFLLWAVLCAVTYVNWLRADLLQRTWQAVEYILATGKLPPVPDG